MQKLYLDLVPIITDNISSGEHLSFIKGPVKKIGNAI